MSRLQLLAVVVLGLALAACGGHAGSHESTPSAVSSPSTPIPTRQASPTPSADTTLGSTASDVETAQAGLIFFLRPPDEPWTPGTSFEAQLAQSDLWVADADGSGERQISSGKTNVSFAGFLVAEDGPVVYYASGDETTFHLWRKALETGAETEVLSFRPPLGVGRRNYTAAAVTPDGRQVALVEGGDITLADLPTGERRSLLQSDKPDCEPAPCFFRSGDPYNEPHWSPDGSLLAVGRTGWEWRFQFIVDPSIPAALASVRPSDIDHASVQLDWSTSDKACTTVWLGSGLYLIRGPDWAFDAREAEDISGYCPDLDYECHAWVRQCAWLDEKRIAIWVTPYPSKPRIEVVDTDTRAITTLVEFAEEPGVSPDLIDMFVLRGEGLIVYNRYHDIWHEEERRHEAFSTVGVIQVANGKSKPILRERDYVVAVAESPRGR